MANFEIAEHSFLIAFFQTGKNKPLTNEILDCVKGFVNKIGVVKENKLKTTKYNVKIRGKEFAVIYISRPYFNIAAGFSKQDSAMKAVTAIINESLARLYEKNWKELSEAFVYSDIRVNLEKGLEQFSQLINQDKWKKLFGNDETFEVKRIEFWQPPSKKLRKGFYLSRIKKEIQLECIRSDVYKGKLPENINQIFLSELEKQANDFLNSFVGEKC